MSTILQDKNIHGFNNIRANSKNESQQQAASALNAKHPGGKPSSKSKASRTHAVSKLKGQLINELAASGQDKENLVEPPRIIGITKKTSDKELANPFATKADNPLQLKHQGGSQPS